MPDPFSVATLSSFAAAGDRYGYWNYLAQYDQYGALALGVVTNETTSGYIGNQFFQSVVADKTGTTLTSAQMWDVGVGLMNADLAARQIAINNGSSGLNLPVATIAAYHGTVFSDATNGQVGVEGWTPWIPLKDAITTGDTARATLLFNSMVQDSTWTNATLATSIGPQGVVTSGSVDRSFRLSLAKEACCGSPAV